jgi:hypothetical protein
MLIDRWIENSTSTGIEIDEVCRFYSIEIGSESEATTKQSANKPRSMIDDLSVSLMKSGPKASPRPSNQLKVGRLIYVLFIR